MPTEVSGTKSCSRCQVTPANDPNPHCAHCCRRSGWLTPRSTRDDRRHGVAEHQPEDQHGGRLLNPGGEPQHQAEHYGRPHRCRGGDGGVSTHAERGIEGGRGAIAGPENDERDAEARPRRDAERERIRERVAEERLHLQAGRAEGGARERGGQRARQSNRLHDDRRGAAVRRSARQDLEDLTDWQRARAHHERQQEHACQQDQKSHEHAELTGTRQHAYRSGTRMYHSNS